MATRKKKRPSETNRNDAGDQSPLPLEKDQQSPLPEREGDGCPSAASSIDGDGSAALTDIECLEALAGTTAQDLPEGDAARATPRPTAFRRAIRRVPRFGAPIPVALRSRYPRAARLLGVLWAVFTTVLALGVITVATLILFRTALVDRQIYSRSDTVIFYFPIANRLIDVLHEGRIILWTRYLFGGFPLFADGEAGMLYPPHLLAYLMMPEQDAFIWGRIIRYLLAGSFTYIYLRTLTLNGFAAVVGALSFAFGSFMITQMHHSNVTNTAIWLPLTLSLVELSVRNVGRWRWLYGTAAGASVGIQSLGLHIQPLLMSGLFLAVYVPFRTILCPIAWPCFWRVGGAATPKTQPAGTAKAKWARRRPAWMGRANGWLAARLPRAMEAARIELFGRDLFDTAPATPAQARGPLSRLRESSNAGRSLWISTGIPARLAYAAKVVVQERQRLGRGRAAVAARIQGFANRRPVAFTIRMVSAVAIAIGHFTVRSIQRVSLAFLLLGMIPTIAFGVAAVQVLPLVELGLASFRGRGVPYQFATSYSLPPLSLVDLIFPYFFRYTNRFYWSLWSEWETTIYFGIATLILATIAIVFVRNRMVLFFGIGTVVSMLLAFGNYSPVPAYEVLWQLPGFSSLRVPGRFGMLATLCVAVLAAYAVDWLCRTMRPVDSTKQRWWSRFSSSAGTTGFGAYLAVLLSAIAALVWWMMSFSQWIEKEPWAVKRFIDQNYLSLRGSKPWLTSDMVLSFLSYSLDTANERTVISLALLLATFLLLFCWFAFRRLWRVWASLVVVLVATDMLLFATDFHPTVHINQLAQPDSASRWLMAHNPNGDVRVYTAKEAHKTEANRLLPFQIEEITGYSSLQTARHQEYMARLAEFDKTLLDLYATKYVVLPKNFASLPSYQYTSYHPQQPLADGPADSRGANVSFYMNPPVRADQVSFISNIRGATEILQDEDVADIVLVDTAGKRTTLKVKAGVDTAEWAYDRGGVAQFCGHKRGEVAAKVPVSDAGIQFQANLYYGVIGIDQTMTVSRIEFHYTNPKGKMRLYGMMLWENPGTPHQILGRDKFIPRYEDDEVVILENPSRLPQAYLVPTAQLLTQPEIMNTMSSGSFDPMKTVILEQGGKSRPIPTRDLGLADQWTMDNWLQGNTTSSPGSATVVDYQSNEVVVKTDSDRNALLFLSDSYYPGWKAYVDGKEERVYRADYLFRAVPVPQGKHEVRFAYEPESFAIGSYISMASISVLLILWVGLVGWPTLKWTITAPVRLIKWISHR